MEDESISELLSRTLSEGRRFLFEHESYEILSSLEIPVVESVFAATLDEAVQAGSRIGYPVVLKVVSPQVIHKSDVGGVFLNIRDKEELVSAYHELLRNVEGSLPVVRIEGVIVQKMMLESTEIIIGATRDPQFGPTMMFGIGGILTEIIKDVSFGVAPLEKEDAERMIGEIQLKKVLEGFRNLPRVGVSAIVDILIKISDFMFNYPRVNEVDLNPILAYEEKVWVVDCRIILGEEAQFAGKTEPDDSNLRSLLEPESVAVVGASSNPDKIGHQILKNIVDAGFKGGLYPINPRGGEILGLETFTSVLEVPGPVDVAVVVVPARFVTTVIGECCQKGVKGAVIISSGFKDVGSEGAALERRVLETAEEGGMRIIGPNCQGVSNPVTGFCATWPLVKGIGDVAVISQSGTIALELPYVLTKNGLGYSKMIALGNKSDVDEADLIYWLGDDASTNVIAVYTEGMMYGRKLMEAINKTSSRKPVLILKGGKTEAGRLAVLAHTGSMAGRKEVYEAAVRQIGGLCMDSLQELCDASVAFSTLPVPKGNRLLVVTSSGGAGILTSDACEGSGLTLSQLSESTLERLKEILPDWCIFGNPLDLTGNALTYPHIYGDALDIAIEDESVDMVLVVFGDPITGSLGILEKQLEKARGLSVPIVVNYMGGAEVQEAETIELIKGGVPVFKTPERAVSALGYMFEYWEKIHSSSED